jgi:hypothetical protein
MWPVDQPMPALMTPGQLMAVLQMKYSRFCRLQRAGAFKFLEVTRPLGRARYSGRLVQQYVNGESVVKFGLGSRRSA